MRDLIDLKELSRRTGYTEKYVYQLNNKRKFPRYRPNNGKVYYDWNEISEIFTNTKIKSMTELEEEEETRSN